MAFNDTTLNLVGLYLAGLCPYVSVHSADPGATGLNEHPVARQACSFNVDADGDLTLSTAEDFSGGTPGAPVLWVGLWDSLTAGLFRGGFPITAGDLSFNGGGAYRLLNLSIPVG